MTESDTGGAIPDTLFEAAAIWAARLREPDCDAAVKAAFQDWLAADIRHPRAYDEVQALWQALDEPARSLAGSVSAASLRPAPRRVVLPEAWSSSRPAARKRSRSRLLAQWTAAAAAGLAGLAAFWACHGGFDDLRSDYVTATGEYRPVALADRSHIDLNTDTALAVDLTAVSRKAHLYRGEAYFDIAADPSRPFTVLTPAGEVQVLGTAFNIRLDESTGMIVSVTRGHVTVAPGGPGEVSPRADLLPGQQVTVRHGKLGPVGGFDPFRLTAWQKGQIVFYRTALGSVVEELNRYRRTPIIITNAAVRRLPVSGVFDLRRPDVVLETLRATLGLHVTNIAGLLVLIG